VANEQRWHAVWDAFTGRGQAVTPHGAPSDGR
jgi:hypothetical protein